MLPGKQARFLRILLASPSLKAAAKKAAIGYATAKRYVADERFAGAYRQAAQSSFEHCLVMLRAGAAKSVRVLLTEMHKGEKSADRVRAAGLLLKLATGAVALEDVLLRLQAIEEAKEAK